MNCAKCFYDFKMNSKWRGGERGWRKAKTELLTLGVGEKWNSNGKERGEASRYHVNIVVLSCFFFSLFPPEKWHEEKCWGGGGGSVETGGKGVVERRASEMKSGNFGCERGMPCGNSIYARARAYYAIMIELNCKHTHDDGVDDFFFAGSSHDEGEKFAAEFAGKS